MNFFLLLVGIVGLIVIGVGICWLIMVGAERFQDWRNTRFLERDRREHPRH